MRTVTHIPCSWHSRTVIRMSSLTFFRHDWRSAWIAIINPFVFVCRRYLSIGEDAWLQPKRMTILHAFYSPLYYHCQCLHDCECPLWCWNGDAVQLNELHAFMLSTVLDSCLQSIFLYIWCRPDTEKYGRAGKNSLGYRKWYFLLMLD